MECKNCSNQFYEQDDLEPIHVLCPKCGEPNPTPKSLNLKRKDTAALPRGFEVGEKNGLHVKVKWVYSKLPWGKWYAYSISIVILTLFGVGIINWFMQAITVDGDKFPSLGIKLAILLIAFSASLYWFLALCFNTTVISVVGGFLSVAHRPIPWPGTKHLRASEINNIYCIRYIAHTSKHSGRLGTILKYKLLALMKNKKRITLAKGFQEVEEILFLKKIIEDKLTKV